MNKVLLFFTAVIMSLAETKPVQGEMTKEELCKTSTFISAKVSPDGNFIAQVGADEMGIANVSIFPVNGCRCNRENISFFKTPDIIQFFWSPDSKIVLLLKDERGTGQLNLHGFNIASKVHLNYTEKFAKVNAKVLKLSSSENKAIIGLNHRNPYFHDLYILDLDSGDFTLLYENNVFAKFLLSDTLEIQLKMKINSDGSWTITNIHNEILMNLTSEEAFNTEFISHDAEENAFYFLDNRFTNTNQLTKKSLISPYEEEVLGNQEKSDVDDVLFLEGKPKAYASYYTQKKWHILNSSIARDVNFLETHCGSNFNVLSQSNDNNVWIISNSIPDKGVYFWIYKREPRTIILLSPTEPEKDLSKMYEIIVKARDGKELVCYYTIPREYDKGGYVESPIPLVVVPHGGPFKVRDKFEFNLYHQWLASCGYAALSVNFRLSAGFGKAFVNAGNGEWGGKAHLDVVDAVEACIKKGITEKSTLAIFGGSYGGYESLAALTFTPEFFTCCVAVCGPSNLKTVLGGVPLFWEFTSKPLSDQTMFFTKQAFITSMGGDPEDPEGSLYLEKCSPLNNLENIKAPLLLVHGKNDHIVAETESKQIYESMKKNNKKVTYILFPNEGHRFSNFSNKMLYLDQAELFLSEHLKGKYRPCPKEILKDSTAQIYN